MKKINKKKKFGMNIMAFFMLFASLFTMNGAFANPPGWFGGCAGNNYWYYYNNGDGTYSYFVIYNDPRCFQEP